MKFQDICITLIIISMFIFVTNFLKGIEGIRINTSATKVIKLPDGECCKHDDECQHNNCSRMKAEWHTLCAWPLTCHGKRCPDGMCTS